MGLDSHEKIELSPDGMIRPTLILYCDIAHDRRSQTGSDGLGTCTRLAVQVIERMVARDGIGLAHHEWNQQFEHSKKCQKGQGGQYAQTFLQISSKSPIGPGPDPAGPVSGTSGVGKPAGERFAYLQRINCLRRSTSLMQS